jgi:hypothetical protein
MAMYYSSGVLERSHLEVELNYAPAIPAINDFIGSNLSICRIDTGFATDGAATA